MAAPAMARVIAEISPQIGRAMSKDNPEEAARFTRASPSLARAMEIAPSVRGYVIDIS